MSAAITRNDGLPIDAMTEEYDTEQAQAWWRGMEYGEQFGYTSGWRWGAAWGLAFGSALTLGFVRLGLWAGM